VIRKNSKKKILNIAIGGVANLEKMTKTFHLKDSPEKTKKYSI
jgi:hypothetical protein